MPSDRSAPPPAAPSIAALAAAHVYQERPPGCAPDWTIAQDWARYSSAEHAVWRELYTRQTAMLQGRACRAFLEGMAALPMGPDRIPDFSEVNPVLLAATGWQVVAVPGLLPDAVFFDHLAHRRFPAGRFIRRSDQLDYLQEPDIFHDVFGHVPMLMNPMLADFIQAYGAGGLRAASLGVLHQLARVYWYTVEFGLVEEDGALRIYGAGIASSYAESRYALEDARPQRLRFALDRVMRTRYRIDDFQESYFVLSDLDELLALATTDFAPVYARIRSAGEIAANAAVAGDQRLGGPGWRGSDG